MRLATIITIVVILASSVSAHAMRNGCHYLDLYVYIDGHQIGRVQCSKGKVYHHDLNLLIVEQFDVKGPSCDVGIAQNGFEVSKIHIQQNLCALKAGDIHVSHLSGKVPTVRIEKGSFSKGRRGAIAITGFR